MYYFKKNLPEKGLINKLLNNQLILAKFLFKKVSYRKN